MGLKDLVDQLGNGNVRVTTTQEIDAEVEKLNDRIKLLKRLRRIIEEVEGAGDAEKLAE